MKDLRFSTACVALALFAAPGVSAQQCWTEHSVIASDNDVGDEFGRSLSFFGDTAFVGAPGDSESGLHAGAVYRLERDLGGPNAWGEAEKILASDGTTSDIFGYSVSLFGDTLAVGAQDDDLLANSGSVYLFERDHGGPDNWGELLKLKAPDAQDYHAFGLTVSLCGDTLVVGAQNDEDIFIGSGAAYVFERDEGGPDNWGLVVKLYASDAAFGDRFGTRVDLDGDTLVVTAQYDDQLRGSAYVFQRNAGGPAAWGEVTKLVASDSVSGHSFGSSAVIQRDTIVIGATTDSQRGGSAGAAYVFERNAGAPDAWGEVQKLTASDGDNGDNFGSDVSLFESTLVVGALGDNDEGSNSGSAYLFERSRSTWSEVKKFNASDGSAGNELGSTLQALETTMVIAAPVYDFPGNSGKLYFFERCGTRYCDALPNSTGAPAAIHASGSASVSANDLSLSAAPVPADQNGIFFYGPEQTQQPFGNGNLCVAGGATGIARLDVVNSGGSGVLTHDVDYTAPPSVATRITPGSTWNFSAWFRDPAAGGAFFNLSDGLSVTFLP